MPMKVSGQLNTWQTTNIGIGGRSKAEFKVSGKKIQVRTNMRTSKNRGRAFWKNKFGRFKSRIRDLLNPNGDKAIAAKQRHARYDVDRHTNHLFEYLINNVGKHSKGRMNTLLINLVKAGVKMAETDPSCANMSAAEKADHVMAAVELSLTESRYALYEAANQRKISEDMATNATLLLERVEKQVRGAVASAIAESLAPAQPEIPEPTSASVQNATPQPQGLTDLLASDRPGTRERVRGDLGDALAEFLPGSAREANDFATAFTDAIASSSTFDIDDENANKVLTALSDDPQLARQFQAMLRTELRARGGVGGADKKRPATSAGQPDHDLHHTVADWLAANVDGLSGLNATDLNNFAVLSKKAADAVSAEQGTRHAAFDNLAKPDAAKAIASEFVDRIERSLAEKGVSLDAADKSYIVTELAESIERPMGGNSKDWAGQIGNRITQDAISRNAMALLKEIAEENAPDIADMVETEEISAPKPDPKFERMWKEELVALRQDPDFTLLDVQIAADEFKQKHGWDPLGTT